MLADGGAFVRAGTFTQPMAWAQMRERLPEKPSAATVESLAHAIEKQTQVIEQLREEIRDGNSWKTKWKDHLVSGVVGAIIGAIVTRVLG